MSNTYLGNLRQVDEVFEGDAFRSGRCRDDPRRPALPRTVSAQ